MLASVGEYFGLLGTLMLYLIPLGLVCMFAFYMVAEIYIRRKVRGGTLIEIWHQDRHKTKHLVRVDSAGLAHVNGGAYKITPQRRYSLMYPDWAPGFMQESVAGYGFVANDYQPIDPVVDIQIVKDKLRLGTTVNQIVNGHGAQVGVLVDDDDETEDYSLADYGLVTAQMLEDITDEKMLKVTVQEAREHAEDQLLAVRKMPLYILIGVGVACILSAINAFFAWQNAEVLKQILDIAAR